LLWQADGNGIAAPGQEGAGRVIDAKILAAAARNAALEQGRTTAMKVNDIMTKDPRTCTSDTTVAEAAHLMWEGDCGILPVVDEGVLDGVVTDRDMYIALATQNARASQLKVGAVATRTVVTCAPEDDVRDALDTMKQALVRRLPVIGPDGTLVGILSMNDMVMAAGKSMALKSSQVLAALQTLCNHHPRSPNVVSAPPTRQRPSTA
jgi:CBS domain-containing protein